MILQSSLLQFVKFTFIDLVLHLPIGPEIGTGVPAWKSLIVTPPHMRHRNESPHCLYEYEDPHWPWKITPAHLHGGGGYHVYINLSIYLSITKKTFNIFISLYFRTLLILVVFHRYVFPFSSNMYLIIT